ncbi:hypothetical protein FRC08_002642 [Ceratobasidium sp. 394]|nr:hypothetical protein FRC08_002642 [Ceratobasidium sp. 394]
MGSEHPKWGPDFDRYFEDFEGRLNKAFDNYRSSRETTSIAHDGLLPLSVLETMLTIGDNMHKLEYQHGERSLTVLMATIRRYTELNTSGIFDYYYGYLCMRHIIRAICIGTLIENEMLEAFLNDLDPALETVEATAALGEMAFDIMTQAFLKNDVSYVAVCLGFKPPDWNIAYTCVGGLSIDDVDFLIMALWNNRRQIITLIEHGMLPGFPALLFTLCEMTMLSRLPGRRKKWTQLQDVILRAYLVGTKDERQIMRHLSIYAHNQIQDHNLVMDTRTDEEDARTVVRAYVEIFDPIWIRDKFLAALVLLDISNFLFQFVDSMITPKMEDCITLVAWGGLERIWLEIDRESDGFMAEPRRGFTRRYAADIFHALSDMQRRLRARENQQAFTGMLMEMDILGLVGRVLLMISREGNNPDKWDEYLGGLESLCDALCGPPPLAAERFFHSNVAQWIKVRDQLK